MIAIFVYSFILFSSICIALLAISPEREFAVWAASITCLIATITGLFMLLTKNYTEGIPMCLMALILFIGFAKGNKKEYEDYMAEPKKGN